MVASRRLAGGSGGGKDWLHSRNVLKVQPTGFASSVDMGYERKRGI